LPDIINYGKALYYPYIEIKDTKWLKAAALYYDSLERIVPDGYTPVDNRTVKSLNEKFKFIKNINPAEAAEDIAPAFIDFFKTQLSSEPWRNAFLKKLEKKPDINKPFSIHTGKIGNQLADELYNQGFKITDSGSYQTYTFDEVTGSLYMTFLANQLAADKLIPVVTDDLLFQPLIKSIQEQKNEGDIGFQFASIIINCSVPQALENTPIQKIIDFRDYHQDERLEFYKAINDLVKDLNNVENKQVLQEILNSRQQQFLNAAKNLKRAYWGVKINAANGLFLLSVPAIALAAGPLIAAGAVLVAAAGKTIAAIADHKKTKAGSPHAYVLSLHNLKSSSLAEDILQGKILF
jgi:hypothetical protein